MTIELAQLNPVFPFVSRLEFTKDRFSDTVQFEQGPLTGILEAGDYRFDFRTEVFVSAKERFITIPTSGSFASSSAQFELSLDRLHGNNRVPDAGSTLAMLGMALSALGGMARLRAVCF